VSLDQRNPKRAATPYRNRAALESAPAMSSLQASKPDSARDFRAQEPQILPTQISTTTVTISLFID
jgi:hypothetical protein